MIVAHPLEVCTVVLDREVLRWIRRVLLPVEQEVSARHDGIVIQNSIGRLQRTNDKSVSGETLGGFDPAISQTHALDLRTVAAVESQPKSCRSCVVSGSRKPATVASVSAASAARRSVAAVAFSVRFIACTDSVGKAASVIATAAA